MDSSLEYITVIRTVRWDDVIVECVFDITGLILTAIQSMEIGVVLGEDQLRFYISAIDVPGILGVDGRWGGKAVEVVSSQ